MKRILIINTGGTISSVSTSSGYAPVAGRMASILSNLPELTHPDMPSFDMIELSPLIDSADLDLSHWCELSELIAKHYDNYQGFVILHGTDTMAFTASALSFMLENLSKPVILTGSQLPLGELRTDAKDNIITALWLAANDDWHDVAIYFGKKLLRGNRTQKSNSYDFRAFTSPNMEPLAHCGTHIQWNKHLLLDKPSAPFKAQSIQRKRIASYRLFPGHDRQWLKELLAMPLEGLILQTYGSGNAPSDDDFLDAFKKASDRGVVICNISQCPRANVDMSTYATGQSLQQAGVTSGFDMTVETAHVKLTYLLSHYDNLETTQSLLQTNLRGELSFQ